MHESSNFELTSTDDELESRNLKDLDVYTDKLVKSKNKADQRFVNMFRVRQAKRKGIHIGF